MSKYYRVLHIDTDKTWRGGQQQIASLIRRLHEMGCHSLLASPPGSALLTRISDEICDCIPLALRGEWDFISAFRLAQVVRREKPDVIHAHSGRAHTLAILAKMFSRQNIPLIVSRRVSFPIRPNLFSRWKYRRADGYIPISHIIAEKLKRFGVPEERIRVVYSGVDPQRFADAAFSDIRRELSIESGALIVGNIAFCDAPKRQIDLIAAMPAVLASAPTAHLVIVGDGPLLDELKERARSLGIGERIHFPGFRQDIGNFLAAFDIFTMVSEEEGLGSSILDAQYFGLPVVATPVGGIPEIVQDGVNGILSPLKNPPKIAVAILQLAASPERRREMGGEGKKQVEENYTSQITAQRTLEAYEKFLMDFVKSPAANPSRNR